MGIKLFDNPLLERALDASWARNEVISNNIANVDTPGYKRMDVNFDEYLRAAVNKSTISGVVSNSRNVSVNGNSDNDSDTESLPKLKVTTDYSTTSMRMDGNNVDIDSEATELAKNQILYNAYTTLLNKDYSMLRTAIREGR